MANFLTIDIGNTLQKAAVFSEDGKMLFFQEKEQLAESDLQSLVEEFAAGDSILSSVGEEATDLKLFLKKDCNLLIFNHTTPLPIRIKYKTPETLGLDRIANAVAANALFPNENVLSIQAGTCLVMDFVTKDAEYLGGSISPGLDMRFTALHHFTKRLPLVGREGTRPLVGKSTEESIRSGVVNGLADEVNGAIERYREQYGESKIILTGGNKNDLEKSIKSTIFAAPNLVLFGLYKILAFNVEAHI